MAELTAEKLNIILTARDKQFAAAMERNQKRVERFARKSQKGLSRTSRSFDGLARTARRLVPILAAAFSARAIANVARSSAEIAKFAQLANTGIEDFQRLAAATDTVFISQEKLADILKDVNDKMGEFVATGGGPMKDFFENIAPLVGVTAQQFANLSGPAALQLFVSSLEKANLSQSQMTFYMEALANDATALIPLLRNGGSEIKRLGQEAEAAGRIMSREAVEGAAELDKEIRQLSDTIRMDANKAIVDHKDELLKLVEFITETVIPAGASLVELFGNIAKAAGLVSKTIGAATGTGADVNTPAKSVLTPGDRAYFDANRDTNSNTGQYYVFRDKNGKFVALPYGDPNTPEIPGVTVPAVPPALPGSGNKPGSGGGSSASADPIKKIRDAYESLLSSVDETAAAELEFARSAAIVNDALNAGVISSEEAASTLGVVRQEMKLATGAAMDFAAVADTIQSSMEDAFMSMIDGTKSAKEAFRDMAKDILRELYRVLVVQQLVGQFKSGGGGILGAVFGGFGGGRASGGPVSAGRPVTVGEHGRELFVPQQAGRVLTAPQAKSALAGGRGGVTVVQNFNFSANGDESVKRIIATEAPRIIQATKQAVIEARYAGGQMRAAFR